MNIITAGSLASLMKSSINYNNEMERLMSDPENEILANKIRALEEENTRLSNKIDSLPKTPNQWNPLG